MRHWVVGVMAAVMIAVLAGCAAAPPAYRVAPDGAKEFVLTMRAGSFSPNSLVVNQGDRVRLVLHSYYQFAFFNFNQFRISRLVGHNAPEVVEFMATERGWYDFTAHAFYPYAQLTLANTSIGDTDSSEHVLYGRLYVQ